MISVLCNISLADMEHVFLLHFLHLINREIQLFKITHAANGVEWCGSLTSLTRSDVVGCRTRSDGSVRR